MRLVSRAIPGLALAAAVAFCAGLDHRAVDAPPTTTRVRFVSSAVQPSWLHARPLFDVDGGPQPDNAPDLSRWWVADVADDDLAAFSGWAFSVGARDADVEPEFVPAVLGAVDEAVDEAAQGAACPITTPPYDARQGYLQATNARAGWNVDGGRGQGVVVADLEGDWNGKHEDLPKLTHVVGRPQGWGWRQHGTAVLGVLVAKQNGKGMTGIVPDVDGVYTASLGEVGPARAIHETAKRLSPGDVLLIELHGPGPNSKGKKGQQGFVPMEWWQPEFDAIKWATAKGIVVVEAAGNGGEDLDAAVYKGAFDRNVRDSGAIVVGAGASTVNGALPARSRLGFSNFGARVDVHGWGGDVATLDYGDLQGCSSADRKYTAKFSGTSSATPVVAGAAVVVEGVYRKQHATPLSPRAVRDLLRATGTPQTASKQAPLTQNIGPLVDVARALAALRD